VVGVITHTIAFITWLEIELKNVSLIEVKVEMNIPNPTAPRYRYLPSYLAPLL